MSKLQLKSLLAQLRALSVLPAESRHQHRIDQLWQEGRKLLIELFPSEKADLASVSRVISQLARLDPGCQTSRYATQRDDRKSLPDVAGALYALPAPNRIPMGRRSQYLKARYE